MIALNILNPNTIWSFTKVNSNHLLNLFIDLVLIKIFVIDPISNSQDWWMGGSETREERANQLNDEMLESTVEELSWSLVKEEIEELLPSILFTAMYVLVELFFRSILFVEFLVKVNNEATGYMDAYKLVYERVFAYMYVRLLQFFSLFFVWYYGISTVIHWWLADVVTIIEYNHSSSLQSSPATQQQQQQQTQNQLTDDRDENDKNDADIATVGGANNGEINQGEAGQQQQELQQQQRQHQQQQQQPPQQQQMGNNNDNLPISKYAFKRSKELSTQPGPNKNLVLCTRIVLWVISNYVIFYLIEYVFDVKIMEGIFDIQIATQEVEMEYDGAYGYQGNTIDNMNIGNNYNMHNNRLMGGGGGGGAINNDVNNHQQEQSLLVDTKVVPLSEEEIEAQQIPAAIFYALNQTLCIFIYYILYMKLSKST